MKKILTFFVMIFITTSIHTMDWKCSLNCCHKKLGQGDSIIVVTPEEYAFHWVCFREYNSSVAAVTISRCGKTDREVSRLIGAALVEQKREQRRKRIEAEREQAREEGMYRAIDRAHSSLHNGGFSILADPARSHYSGRML